MPISSNADYIPVMDEFLAHWAIVDAESPLTVPIDDLGVVRGDFAGSRGDLDTIKSQLEGLLNTLEISRVNLHQARVEATARISEFNRRVRAQFPNSPRFSKLPQVPAPSSGRDGFLSAMDDVKDLWARINATPATASFTPPMLLQGELSAAQFATSRTAMDAAFTARASAETQVGMARGDRDGQQANALRVMTGYRAMVEALYPVGSNFVLTLPRLSPAAGHTPDPVAVTAVWVPAETKARVEWEASADAELQDYQVRAVPGEDYATDDASVLETFPPAAPRTYLTASGFAIPGASMTYKVFTRLTTGNEAGSEAQTVTRP